MEIYRREDSSLYQGKLNDIYKRTYIQKKTTTDIHNNKKLRNLSTGINIHPTQIHMIVEPFDASVRMT